MGLKKSKKSKYKKMKIQGIKVKAVPIFPGIVAVSFDDLPKMYKAKKIPLITTE